jgi:hypothetical protein
MRRSFASTSSPSCRLDALATGAVDRADPQRYESLPLNESKMLSVLVTNATVISGRGIPPFIADIGLLANRRVQVVGGRRELQTSLMVEDFGDLRTMGALRTIDATGMTASARRRRDRWGS